MRDHGTGSVDGVPHVTAMISYDVTIDGRTTKHSSGAPHGYRIQLAVSGEAWFDVVRFARTLKGVK